jgi:hypothetical protein
LANSPFQQKACLFLPTKMVDPSQERNLAFSKVKTAYQHFYQRLKLLENSPPYRSTKSGMWATSAAEEIYRAFCHFELDQYRHVADLGSGDGIVVAIASLFTRATGYEIDEWLYQQSIKLSHALKLPKATFFRKDFLQANLTGYDLLYLYPDKPLYELEERLLATWSGRLLVSGPHFPPRYLRKTAECKSSVGGFVLYESP